MNKRILDALRMDQDEEILITLRSSFKKSSPQSRFKDLVNYRFITSKRIVYLEYFVRTNKFTITDYFHFKNVNSLDLQIRHNSNKKEPLFHISLTKVPVLTINAEDELHELNLTGILFLKNKIDKLVSKIKKANPNVNISLNWKRDDFGEAAEEILYDGMDKRKKYRFLLVLLALVIVWALAVWRIFQNF